MTDWQTMMEFSITFAIAFHLVGHAIGYVAYRIKDRKIDNLLRAIRNTDERLDDFRVKRVK